MGLDKTLRINPILRQHLKQTWEFPRECQSNLGSNLPTLLKCHFPLVLRRNKFWWKIIFPVLNFFVIIQMIMMFPYLPLYETEAESYHIILLIKAVAEKYLQIRYFTLPSSSLQDYGLRIIWEVGNSTPSSYILVVSSHYHIYGYMHKGIIKT